jgi:hypothetical protein
MSETLSGSYAIMRNETCEEIEVRQTSVCRVGSKKLLNDKLKLSDRRDR